MEFIIFIFKEFYYFTNIELTDIIIIIIIVFEIGCFLGYLKFKS